MATKQNQPEENRTHRLPLFGSLTTRAGNSTKGTRYINCIPEAEKDDTLRKTKTYLTKRSGVTSAVYALDSGEARGCIYFDGHVYSIVGNKVYKDAGASIITLTNSTGPAGMRLGNSTSIGDYLFICDGIKGWVVESDFTVTEVGADQVLSALVDVGGSGYTTATVAFSGGGGSGAAGTVVLTGDVVTSITITDHGTGYTSAPTATISGDGTLATATAYLSGFPSPHVPTPIYMDGYMFLSKGSDINSSYLDDPTLWDSSDFIAAEMYPDAIKALARHNNQVVALGETSTEFFYDAANATGSPLSRNDAVTIQIGVAAPYAVSEHERNIIWITQSESGGRSVHMLEGFVAKPISDEHIDRILELETSPQNIRGYRIRTKGHFLYLINLPVQNRTLVWDSNEKLWTEWSTFSGSNHTMFEYNFSADDNTGKALLQHNTNGDIMRLDPSTYQDNGGTIRTQINTARIDADSNNRKFLHSLVAIGDTQATGQVLNVRWSDDDQATYTTVRTIALDSETRDIKQCGSFRRRNFEVYHDGNSDLRLEALELEFSEGIH